MARREHRRRELLKELKVTFLVENWLKDGFPLRDIFLAKRKACFYPFV